MQRQEHITNGLFPTPFCFTYGTYGWLRGTVVERRSVTGELSLFYARPAADG